MDFSQFDFDKLAAQVERARIAAEQFDFDKIAVQVEKARIAAEQFDFDKMAVQVEKARIVAEQFDFDKMVSQVEQARIAAEQFDFDKVAVQAEQARLAASSLLAAMPRLTPELFGGAWDERVAASVGRLERTEAITEDPKRAIEELAEDAATVKEAAPPGAKERVNARLFWLWLQRFLQLAQLAKFTYVAFDVLTTLLDLPLLGVNALDLPTVPAPDLPTTHKIEPVPIPLEEDPSTSSDPDRGN